MPKCPTCQRVIADDTPKCPYCRMTLDTPAEPEPEAPNELTTEILAVLDEGGKIAAIKHYRAATGAGLAEAKEAVEAIENGQQINLHQQVDAGDLKQQVINLLESNQKIEAIKVYRAGTGAGLSEAKEAVEAMEQDQDPQQPSSVGGSDIESELLGLLKIGKRVQAIKQYRKHHGGDLKTAMIEVNDLAERHNLPVHNRGCVSTVMFCLLGTMGGVYWLFG